MRDRAILLRNDPRISAKFRKLFLSAEDVVGRVDSNSTVPRFALPFDDEHPAVGGGEVACDFPRVGV